jgi:hypothetical protein
MFDEAVVLPVSDEVESLLTLDTSAGEQEMEARP